MRLRTFRLSAWLRACLLVACAARLVSADQWDPPPTYYAAATGTGATLKGQLLTIMSTGQIMRSYGNFRDSAVLHDADPNHPGNILLVYNRASVPGAWDPQVPYWNREHLWPQARQPGSLDNGSTGSLGDPHALRPANPTINGNRGDTPFGGTTPTGSHGDGGGGYYYPGNADRGDVARQLFYDQTRYASVGLSLTDVPIASYGAAQMGDLPSLLAYHYLDPPDEFERRRNHVIYSQALNPFYTNNRNAYVDNPEFVWSVYGDDANDSQIVLQGGGSNTDGSSSLAVDLGRRLVGSAATQGVTLNKAGADGTFFRVTPSGDATSSITGKFNAFALGAGNRSLTVGMNSSVAGPKSGGVTIDNLDITLGSPMGQGGTDANDVVTLSASVLDHANASFAGGSDSNSLSYNFGTLVQGSAAATFGINIFNLSATPNFTAGLDLDAIEGSGATNVLTTNLAPFSGGATLAAGSSRSFTATLHTNTPGVFSASYTLNVSDEDLPGATALTSLTLMLSGTIQVAPPTGDFDENGFAEGADFLAWQRGVGMTSGVMLANGDGNRNGVVDGDDLVVWQGQFGQSLPNATGVPEPAAAWLAVVGFSCLRIVRRLRRVA